MILSLGSVNADFELRVDYSVGSKSAYRATDLLCTGGGKAANVAYLARCLGADVQLLSSVGDDDLSAQALQPLVDAGVDVGLVVHRGDTNVSVILVPPDGVKTIALTEGEHQQWNTARFIDAVVAAPSGSLLTADLEAPVDVVTAVARAARGRDLPVVLDPAPADRMTDELYSLATFVVPDYEEASSLVSVDASSDDGALRAAIALHERGVDVACVKLKEGGCAVASGGERAVISAVDVTAEQVDLTGAGDAFAGALSWSLHRGDDVMLAVEYGVAASTLAVEGYGSQESYPTRAMMDERRKHLRRP